MPGAFVIRPRRPVAERSCAVVTPADDAQVCLAQPGPGRAIQPALRCSAILRRVGHGLQGRPSLPARDTSPARFPGSAVSRGAAKSSAAPRRGNKQLKRAFFLSAFAALGDPASRANYDKKIAQGQHHTQALLCLARRRADVRFAMFRDGTFCEPQPSAPIT